MQEVGKPSGLVRRKGSSSLYFRQRWPKRFQREGTPNEIWISLNTAVWSEAVARLPDARRQAEEEFRRTCEKPKTTIQSKSVRLIRPDDPTLRLLLPEETLPLAQDLFRRAVREMDAKPLLAAQMDAEQADQLRMEWHNRKLILEGHVEDETEDILSGAEADVLKRAGCRAAPDSESGRLLREYLRLAMIELSSLRSARFEGDYSDRIVCSHFQPERLAGGLSWTHSVPAAPVATIKDVAEAYLEQRLKGGMNEKTKDRYRSEVKHIIAYFGPTSPITKINAIECDQFRDTFSLLPPNFEDRIRSGSHIAEIAKRRHADDPRLAWATLNKYLSQLSSFVKWACKRDYLAKDYADGLKPLEEKPQGSTQKFPFHDDELHRIFGRPIYTGCRDDRYGFARSGDNIIRRSRYWAPLIALFTGLRCGEILQLTPDHFRISPNGHNFIVLTPDMALKNDNAVREIPVHSMLEKIGLVQWVRRRADEPNAPLFPEVPQDKRYGHSSSRFSKWYESDLKYFELGVRRKRLTFHSFRHTFKRGLDRADVREDKKDEICGWARGKKTGRRYGSGLEADVLKSSVEAVRYEIDLTHLFAHAGLSD